MTSPDTTSASLLQQLADFLLPACCPLCPTAGRDLCQHCRTQLKANTPACQACGAKLANSQADESCQACHGKGLSSIQQVFAPYRYEGSLIALIRQAKASACPAATHSCAQLLSEALSVADPELSQVDAIVAVPAARGRRPGQHLASALARHLATQLGIPLLPALKHKHLPAAQHSLSKGQRQRNVAELFSCRQIFDKTHLMLIDDLLTTGATAQAAARCLRQAGAASVKMVSLARASHRVS